MTDSTEDGQSVSTTYALSNGTVLLANASGKVTAYLYGIDAIGEQTDGWCYALIDGTGTPRQMVDQNAKVTALASYTPWGDVLNSGGTGSFSTGYFGGMMDAATGLIYVGNGQYYDPLTGRFLTRGANGSQTNPYVPWKGDPASALISPLLILGLVFQKKKHVSKLQSLLIILIMVGSVGMSITACGPSSPTSVPSGNGSSPTVPPSNNNGDETGTESSNTGENPGQEASTPTPPCTSTPKPTTTPTLLLENWTEIARVLYYEGASSFSDIDYQRKAFTNAVWSLRSIKLHQDFNSTYTSIIQSAKFSASADTYGSDKYVPSQYIEIAKSILSEQKDEPIEFQNKVVHFLSPQHWARRVGNSGTRQEFQHDSLPGCAYSGDESSPGNYCQIPDLRVLSFVKAKSIESLSLETFMDLGVLGAYASGNSDHGHVRYQQDYYYQETYWIGFYFFYENEFYEMFELGNNMPPGPSFPPESEEAKVFQVQ